MASSDSQIHKPQLGRPKRAELLNTERLLQFALRFDKKNNFLTCLFV